MKNTTGPKPKITVDDSIPWTWADFGGNMKTLSVRVSGSRRKNPAWDNPNVEAVRLAIKAAVKTQGLSPRKGYAITIWDLLPHLNPVDNRSILVNALNAHGSGLEVVRPRRYSLAS